MVAGAEAGPTTAGGPPTSARLAALARLGAELTGADDLESLTDIITRGASEVMGAAAAALALREGPTRMKTVGSHGLDERARRRWAWFDSSDDVPLAEVVRTGEPVVLADRADLIRRYPHLDEGRERSSVTLPLVAPGVAEPIGAVGFRFEGRNRPLDADELAVLRVVTDMCAQTMRRLQLAEESAVRAARLQFLADASAVFGGSLDRDATIAKVARLLVPTHADWVSVQLLDDGMLRTLALAHVDPTKVELALDLQRRWPPEPGSPSGAMVVARTGRSELVEEVTDEMLVAAARDDEHLALSRALGLRSALIVPLRAHGRVLGVLTLVWAESDKRYGPDDVPFAEDLARRAALAIDNADLYSQTHRLAAELQANLLARALPVIPGWDLASVYRQAGRTDVGGDFYDVIDVGRGRVAVFIGDVMGRGVDAAVAGSRMRAAARVLALQRPEPGELARAMDRLMTSEELTPLATAAYLMLDPPQNRLRAVVAGHPPPLLLTADGAARFLTGAGSPVHGVGQVGRPEAEAGFGVGDLLVLYTDGLVERRSESIDVGLARLADAADVLREEPARAQEPPTPVGVAAATAAELEVRLARLVDAVSDPERHDDVAVLVLRRTA